MLKIYLDQKDYSSLARGISGEKNYDQFVEIYSLLKKLVTNSKIEIFFSWVHVVEALRYGDLNSEFWKVHCDVVDTLTMGKCIIFPVDLQSIELNIFLSEFFGFGHPYQKINYPYGKYKDAVPFPKLFTFDILKKVKKDIAKNKSRNERRLIFKNLSEKNKLKEYFKSLTESDFRKLFPVSGNKQNFIQLMSSYLSREIFIDFIVGTPFEQSAIFGNFLDYISQFKNLVNICGPEFSELKKVSEFPLKQFGKIEKISQLTQLLQSIKSESIIDPNTVKAKLISHYVQSLSPTINALAKKHKFSRKEAERILVDQSLRPIKCIHSYILGCIEYVKKLTPIERARTPKISDILDLYNLMYIPYVDIFLTDKFIADMIKRNANEYKDVRIFHNLRDLYSNLCVLEIH